MGNINPIISYRSHTVDIQSDTLRLLNTSTQYLNVLLMVFKHVPIKDLTVFSIAQITEENQVLKHPFEDMFNTVQGLTPLNTID